MNIVRKIIHRRSEQGSVAVEMASVLFLFILLLGLLLFWARVFWYYSMAQKAAHDAARFLSRATPAEMQTLGPMGGEAPSATVARWIADSEIGTLRPMMRPYWIYVECGVRNSTGVLDYGNCGADIPDTVRVKMQLVFTDQWLPDVLLEYFGMNKYTFRPDVTMRYVGN